MAATVIFLTSGTTWVVPSDWNSANNTIECIGGGGGCAGFWGNAGGGGAYSKSVNVTLTKSATVSIKVGAGAAGTSVASSSYTLAGGDTFLCNDGSGTVITAGDVVVGAKGASATTSGGGGTGGASSAGVASGTGSVKYSGGNAGTQDYGCGGGGGAAGPLGNGGNGGNSGGGLQYNGASGGGGNGGGTNGVSASGQYLGKNGGDNHAGTGHGAGSSTTAPGGAGTNGGGGGGAWGGGNGNLIGGNGGAGTEWSALYGSGGGGGGGTYTNASGHGGAGGGYGGGAGGGGDTVANGANGLIVVTYTAALPAPSPSSISPTSGNQGATITTFTVNGTNFSTPTLSFSGTGITVNSYSVQSSTQVVANITIAGGATGSARDVIITNADAQTGTLAASFTVVTIYSISGNAGVAGATVALSGAASASTSSAADGTYSFAGLVAGAYVITPTLSGVTFTPTSLNETIVATAITTANLVAQATTFVSTPTVSDNFHRADAPNLGANWTVAGGDPIAIVSHLAVSDAVATQGAELYTGLAFTPDQYVAVTFGAFGVAGGSGEVDIFLRTDPTNATGYDIALYNGNQLNIIDLTIGSAILITTISSTPAPGDIFSAQIVGTLLTVFYNGVPVASVTNASTATGIPGMYIADSVGQTLTSVSLFTAGAAIIINTGISIITLGTTPSGSVHFTTLGTTL